jgi:hypothetical protein
MLVMAALGTACSSSQIHPAARLSLRAWTQLQLIFRPFIAKIEYPVYPRDSSMDFTEKRYRELLDAFKAGGYSFYAFEDFIRESPEGPVIILRHDVDRSPGNALRLARIENDRGNRATYYFRTTRAVFRPKIIQKIVRLGHEIGYHYEDLSLTRGNFDKAIALFELHLEQLRKYYPVSTICRHGSPLSKYDNKKIWEKYNYRDFRIIAEPYLDVDYAKVLYITDTGRRWNDQSVNIRDKIQGLKTGLIESSTKIMEMVEQNQLHKVILLNTHPDKWHNNVFSWTCDLVFQSFKNVIKSSIINASKNNPR